MSTRSVLVIGALILVLAAVGGGAYWQLSAAATPVAMVDPDPAPLPDDEAPLPIPPVPPRIAEGEDYEHCLGLLSNDPAGAASYADIWQKKGGGEGATHCQALARIALGNPGEGAAMLQALANTSHGNPVARASVYGQAGQAWLMAGDNEGAYGAATLALTLSPDDPDLLIDRAVDAAALQRYRSAVDDLTHVLDVDPKRADALVFRGSAWRHLGKLDLAADDIDRALAMDPDDPEALLERGILRQRRNDRRGARADWEHAVQVSPDSTTADLAQQNLSLLDAGPAR